MFYKVVYNIASVVCMPLSSKCLTASTGEKIVKSGQYLAKIWTKCNSLRAYDSNFCFDIWRVTNADYLLTYLLLRPLPIQMTQNHRPWMTCKVSDNQYGWPYHSDSYASCFII